jgi:hypothetical protein
MYVDNGSRTESVSILTRGRLGTCYMIQPVLLYHILIKNTLWVQAMANSVLGPK